MSDQATYDEILEAVEQLGEQLRAALREDDMDAVLVLAKRRQALVDRLEGQTCPNPDEDLWKERQAALMVQGRELERALAERAERFDAALRDLDRIKRATERYHERPTTSRILNSKLRG